MRVALRGQFPLATNLTYAEACRALHAAEESPVAAEFFFSLAGSLNERGWTLVACPRLQAARFAANPDAYVIDLPIELR